MANVRCIYCEQNIDLDTNSEHFLDTDFTICHKWINKLQSIEYGGETFYHDKGELEIVENSHGDFDTEVAGWMNDFKEAYKYDQQEKQLNHNFPDR